MHLFDSRVDSQDPVFIELRDRPKLHDQKAFVADLFARFAPYADRGFCGQFSSKCVSRFWEMYLTCALLDHGFELRSRKELGRAGPDICVQWRKSSVWIEAVTIETGTGEDALSTSLFTASDRFQLIPEDKIVLRFCSVIKDKFNKYQEYLKKGVIRKQEPFIIAVNGAGIPIEYFGASPDIPYAIQSVLPFGEYTVTLNPTTRKVIQEGPAYRSYICKKSGATVPTSLFLNGEYSPISGLVFANAHPWFSSSHDFGSISMLHNYEPSPPLPDGWLGFGREWKIRREDDRIRLDCRVVSSAA